MYKANNIGVIGAGVAGSTLAYLAKRDGIGVEVYDVSLSYNKPCGEAIPAWITSFLEDNGIPLPEIIDGIKVFSIYNVEGKVVRRVEFNKNIWYIINKSKWINNIRRNIDIKMANYNTMRQVCNRGGLVFDARGPFSSDGVKIVVWQADLENNVGIHNESIQVIDFNNGPGLVWVFSKGDELNIGGGFYGSSDPRQRSIKLLNKILGIKNIEKYVLNEKYSILTLIPRIKISNGRCIRLGEAAGLVMSLGGEGIRPALLSAIYAYKALERDDENVLFDEARYQSYLRPLIYQVRLNRIIFRLGVVFGQAFVERVLKNIDENLLEEWFSGNLGLKTSLTSLLYRVLKIVLSHY